MPSSNESNAESAENPVCGVCGSALAADRLGAQCPRCLLSLASGFGQPGDADLGDDLLDALQVRSFGDYELLQEIARGGMGIVYRARQISLGRDVAIKMILAGELAGRAALRMFQVEAHAAANLHHPNIVPVYEIGERETQHYFTMRFVPGGMTIADWAKTRRSDYRAIAAAAGKVARAVAYAHARSILHRDLKPSNILWDAESGPQVTDFGLAKVLDAGGSAATHTVHAIGSPSYMAPEQMHGRTAEITTATDVYGIGAILYEMLAGRPPFAGDSPVQTMRRAAEEAPAPLPGVPRDLHTVCLKCLAKEQADRYESPAMLAEDLERFVRGEPVSALPLSMPQTLWRWAKRQPRMATLLALCLLLLLGGVSGILWEWQKAERARAQQATALDRLHWQEIDHWLDDGDAPRAIAYLASIIREQPDRWQAVMYAMSIVDRSSFPVLAGPEIHPPAKLVRPACLSPDGAWLAGAGEDQAVRVWDTASGKETAQLPQASPITALAAANGPAALAVATQDGALTLHATVAAPSTALARSLSGPISELSFSADGSRLLARCESGVEVWRMSAPTEPPEAFSLDAELNGASLSADGRRVFAWNAREAAVWDAATGRELLRISATQRFRYGALSAGGGRMALLDGSFTARVWDVDTGQPFPPFESRLSELLYLALDAAGDRLTLAGISNTLTVIDVASGLPVSPPMRHHYSVMGLQASPDGARTMSYGRDDTVRFWDARTGQTAMLGIPLGGVFQRFPGLAFSHDGSMALVHTATQQGAAESLTVWRATRKNEPRRRAYEGERDFDAARLSPDGRLGAVGLSPVFRALVFDLQTNQTLLDARVEGGSYAHLFSADARRYFVFTAKGWLYGWSLGTGRELWKPNHQPGSVRATALSPDGARIVVGHTDGHIRIYDTATGEVVKTLDHPGEVKALQFAPDGSGRFVSGSTDRIAHVWDVHDGRLLQTFTGHTDTIISAAWSPDSRLIATASFDQTARVWDAATGRPVGAIMPHASFLAQVAFGPSGDLLATACRDGSARLWHASTGQPASSPLLQGTACETVRFTADGAALLVRDHDGFRFWNPATAEPVTVRYLEPESAGLGMDSENYRAIMSDDGRHVFLGHSMNETALWSIAQPRGRAPAWLPEFLEMLAQSRLDVRGEIHSIDRREAAAALSAWIRQTAADDEFSAWARRILSPAE